MKVLLLLLLLLSMPALACEEHGTRGEAMKMLLDTLRKNCKAGDAQACFQYLGITDHLRKKK